MTCGDPSRDLLMANAAVRLPAKKPMEVTVPPRADVELDDDVDDDASDAGDEPDEPSVETMSKEVRRRRSERSRVPSKSTLYGRRAYDV